MVVDVCCGLVIGGGVVHGQHVGVGEDGDGIEGGDEHGGGGVGRVGGLRSVD